MGSGGAALVLSLLRLRMPGPRLTFRLFVAADDCRRALVNLFENRLIKPFPLELVFITSGSMVPLLPLGTPAPIELMLGLRLRRGSPK